MKVRKTNCGDGVFATEKFNPGDIVFEFSGPIVRDIGIVPEDEDYYLQIGPNKYLGPSGDLDDIFNHSCNPNCAIIISDDVELMCIKPIDIGDEITYDYSLTSTEGPEEWSMECKCGSKNCRKVISGAKCISLKQLAEYAKMAVIPDYVSSILLY